MPNIRENSAPAGIGLNPTETGIDAIAGAARRGGAFYNQAADAEAATGARYGQDIRAVGDQVLAYEDHREISAGAAAASQMFVNLDQKWNDTLKNADPNDPSVAAKFREETLEPALEQFSSGFNTENSQKFADGIAAKYRDHFFQKTAADMSTMAGIAAKQNATATINNLSSAVYSDPSSLDTAIDTLKHSADHIVDSSPTIDAETGARVKAELNQKGIESIVKSAVSGMIEKNPNIDLDAIQKKYGEYINGAELKQFQKAAQVQAKSNALIDKQQTLLQKQIAEQNVRAASSKVITDNVTFDPQTGKPIIDPKFFQQTLDIVKKNPNAPNAAETFRTMASWGESQQGKGEKPIDDPVVKSDLMTRMFSPDNPTTTLDLMKARAEGKISDPSFQAMHGLVQELEQTPIKGPVWDGTIAAVKSDLVLSGVGLPGKDIKGEENYAKWAQSFIPQYLAMKRSNTLPPNALDVKDPNSMISQSMRPFHRSVQERAADYMSVLGVDDKGIVTPRSTPTVTSKEQFDALKSGETYVGADGKTYRKP